MNNHKAAYTIDDPLTGDGHFAVGDSGPLDFEGAMAVLTQAGRTSYGARDRLHDAMARAMSRACGRHIDITWRGPIDYAEVPFHWGYVCYVEKSTAMIPTGDPREAYWAARAHRAVCAGPAAGRQP